MGTDLKNTRQEIYERESERNAGQIKESDQQAGSISLRPGDHFLGYAVITLLAPVI